MYVENRFYQEDDWVFVAIPKNGSTTILNAFGYDFHQEKSSLIHYNQIGEYSKSFAVLRNPYERLVSCWKNRIVQHRMMESNPELVGMNFPQFVEAVSKIDDTKADAHFRSQSWFLDKVNKDTLNLIDIDNLNDDWYMIEEITNRKLEMVHLKKSNKGDYRSYYTDKLKQLVEDRYQNDFNLPIKFKF